MVVPRQYVEYTGMAYVPDCCVQSRYHFIIRNLIQTIRVPGEILCTANVNVIPASLSDSGTPPGVRHPIPTPPAMTRSPLDVGDRYRRVFQQVDVLSTTGYLSG